MKKIKFLRSGTRRFKRLGMGNKKKQKWRKARGIHSKIREKKKSGMRRVEIGFKKKNVRVILVRNLREAEKIKKGELIIIGKVGKKKRTLLENKIKEKGGEIKNIRK